ncbi:MAG TPA: biotin/lipoyl-binding protein [Candidatus Paceibacterota bacterium]|nr:biotin/lipoyl-binding protein [Candidatus Paceibacterota bacterium]
MKKTFLTILNKPQIVTVASLLIAGIIAYSYFASEPFHKETSLRGIRTEKAISGNITLGNAIAGTSTIKSLTLAFSSGGQIKDVRVDVGQAVKRGDVLATLDPQDTLGRLTQARASYDAAVANYQKVINGASSPAIEVAKSALNTARVAHDEAVRQQETLVENAFTALLNSTFEAYPLDSDDVIEKPPVITGSYLMGKEGQIMVETYRSNADSGYSFRLSGLLAGGGTVSTITPQPLGSSGLYIQFPNGVKRSETWVIAVPNTKAPDYITKYNAYHTALRTKEQVLATTEASVTQAEANLNSVVASARPEDIATALAQVEAARGALQVAQSAFDMRKITAPVDGIVTAIRITAGQSIVANAPSIDMGTQATEKEVSVMVPNSAVFQKDGKSFVSVSHNDVVEIREVVTGNYDGTHTEILSGVSVGEEVVIESL